jgi:protein-tyrosine-phosphatase
MLRNMSEGNIYQLGTTGRREQASSVLFVCTDNATRSPMAESILRSMAPVGISSASAGLSPDYISVFTIEVMKEMGMDVADHEPLSVGDLSLADFDYVIRLYGTSTGEAAPLVPGRVSSFITWDVPDPANCPPGILSTLTSFRRAREDLRSRIACFLDEMETWPLAC